MRYLINEQDTDEATALARYHAVVRWAAAHADRFLISLQRHIYDDPSAVARFSGLGEVVTAPSGEAPASLAQRGQAKLSKGASESLNIGGAPSEELIRALTEQTAPPNAIAGDLSPVEDILLFSGARTLYSLYDYGRTQMLDLDEQELADLYQTLQQAGLDPAVVVVAPPYTTGEP